MRSRVCWCVPYARSDVCGGLDVQLLGWVRRANSLVCHNDREGAVELALVADFVAHGNVDLANDLGRQWWLGRGREGGIDAGDFVVNDGFQLGLSAFNKPLGFGEDYVTWSKWFDRARGEKFTRCCRQLRWRLFRHSLSCHADYELAGAHGLDL